MDRVEYRLINDNVVKYKSVVVYKFSIYEEDPDLYVGSKLYEWGQTPQGQFVKERATDTMWERRLNYMALAQEYAVIAKMDERHLTEFYLKWGQVGSN